MLKAPTEFVIVFIIISVLLILALIVFISVIIYRYQQKQNTYFKDIESLKAVHENTLLQSQLEIQEQTFQNISREIHDNIGQKLTLAKLYLNIFDFSDKNKAAQLVNDSIKIIGDSINDLSNLSHSLSSEIILNNGIIVALEHEQNQLKESGLFEILFSTTGNLVYLDNNTDLVIFRIVQEVLNNIVKHASASIINIHLHYSDDFLSIEIDDNGKGFIVDANYRGTGVQNIKKRTALLKGDLEIKSIENTGSSIKIKIPLYENRTDI
jgi:signal transduction histidine kinase